MNVSLLVPKYVLLCQCGAVDHPDVNRPEIWLTDKLVQGLCRDIPLTMVGECSICGYTVYVMRKCVCK